MEQNSLQRKNGFCKEAATIFENESYLQGCTHTLLCDCSLKFESRHLMKPLYDHSKTILLKRNSSYKKQANIWFLQTRKFTNSLGTACIDIVLYEQDN